MLTSAPPDAASPQIATCRSPDTPHEVTDERFDSLTRLARSHFAVATALIMPFDAGRQWPCASTSVPDGAMSGDGMLVVADTHADECFHHHPLLIEHPWMRFYAGCPLLAADGHTLGVFVLLDDQPRELDDQQREFLRDLARLAAAGVESDRANVQLQADAAALRDREHRMALAIAGSGTGVWDRNVQTGEIHYSSGWKAILGYTDAEIGNRIEDSYQRIHPDDLARVQATIQAHLQGETESYAVEHRIRCKDGHYKWISSRGKVVSRDREGRPLRMIGTTTDITAMHALSERLQQSVDLLTNLTNEVPGLVFQYQRLPTGESLFPYASAGIQAIYEITAEQVAASDALINALIHPNDLPAYRAALDASAASLTPWDLEYRVQLPRQGLRWRHGAAQPRRLKDGSILWHGFITDVTERKRIEAELLEFATTDFLTQLPNRRHLMSQIEAELAHMQRSADHCTAVLMCDLDHFKSINDQWGHATGDLALRHFAGILRAQLRKSDMAGRIGGEEFAVLLRGANLAEAMAFARRVQQQLAQAPLQHGEQCIAMTLSIGVAVLMASDTSVDAALSRSDMALYRAKSSGRNRIECL
ncbi:diguanylate cyclase [Pseudomonas sp. NW5]|uniref:sensor domain-containing diguanylate cyclase n=1 Tax=Pseudomonas sp. NW5 TaxID=2934934 RepID=UPI0020220105|nr:diguanylate cyclase [Pseudomonas sp. NW5]MCL7462407.1 diguanylate cyclase [Pseudomonas sp. NW5]